MQLRHIRPRTVEWYDALMEEDRQVEHLAPEQIKRLRSILSMARLPRDRMAPPGSGGSWPGDTPVIR